jgi:surface antigen
MPLGHQQYWAESSYDDGYRDFESFTLNVEPTERVGPPLPNRFKSRLRAMLLAAILLAGAWAAVANLGLDGVVASARSAFDVIVSHAQEIAARANQRGEPSAEAEANVLGAASPSLPGLQIDQAGGTNIVQELPPPQDEKAAPGEAAPTESIGSAYEEKAEPAEDAPDKTPQRKHAIAAGLGPDLPNVLLTRLSKTDLRNAAYAIKTALAKTPDDGSFTWPPKPSRQQALFEVRFVTGAAQGCRRYIVTVTKDRWSSTSAALEKCTDGEPHAG